MILTCHICKTQYEKGMVHACNNTFIDDAPRIRLERDALLVERQKTHGDFENNAKYFNGLSKQLPDNLPGRQRLAMVMILAKISRIHSGNCMTKDHWDDIAGYAKLGSEACETGITQGKTHD
jgi:hypothetical protein